MKILLTSARSPAGLELARIFNEHGHRVFVADSFAITLCHFSNAVDTVFSVPAPNLDPLKYVNAIKKIVKKHAIDLLVPLYEETFYIAQHRALLSPHCRVFVDDLSKLKLFHNKYLFIKWCEKNQINTPKTSLICSVEALESAIENSLSAYILKPVYSRFSEQVYSSKQDFSRDELCISEQKQWVLQSFVEGKQYSAYALTCDGEVRGLSIYAHQQSGFNVSLHFTAHQSTQITAWVCDFVKKSHFSGNISFDLIVDEKGDIFPIECNPRITSGIHLFRGHTDFMAIFSNKRLLSPLIPSVEKTAALSLLTLCDRGSVLNFTQRINLVRKSRDLFFEKRDPLPAVGQVITFIYLVYLRIKRRESLTQVSMWDIEYNGDEF